MGAVTARDQVDVTPFRERFEYLMTLETEDWNLSEVARRAGWVSAKSGKPDGTYVARLLGLKDWATGCKKGKRYPPSKSTGYIRYEVAVKMADALELDYFECGI